jgi:hypothetical protein
MAKPIKDRVPLTAAWNAIKSGNDTLKKSPMFKPDVMGPIGNYDKALLGYTKQLTDRLKLSDFFKEMSTAFSADTASSKQHADARDKIDKETDAKTDKYADELEKYGGDPDADMSVVCAAITNFCANKEEGITLHRALSEKMFAQNMQRIAALNKIRDNYKAKATAIAANMAKYEKDVLALETQIRSIINTYAKISIEMNHDDAGQAARELLEKF